MFGETMKKNSDKNLATFRSVQCEQPFKTGLTSQIHPPNLLGDILTWSVFKDPLNHEAAFVVFA